MSHSSTGLPENIANVACYVFGWLSGLVMLFAEKSSGAVKFHAAQSVVFFGTCSLLGMLLQILPIIGPLALRLVAFLMIAVWVIQIVTAFIGKPLRLPVVSGIAVLLIGYM
ncbi:DUF4870 domain-containing protein [Marinagarivorans algicola]|uniref:DUF4870 domain-containing protein n=1 Tax=Marinagarivorans algicola TaxID=1513270 RepID=UPI0037369DF6